MELKEMEYIGYCRFAMNFKENHSIKKVEIIKVYPVLANSMEDAQNYIFNNYEAFCRITADELSIPVETVILKSFWECNSVDVLNYYPDLMDFEIPDFKNSDFEDIRNI